MVQAEQLRGCTAAEIEAINDLYDTLDDDRRLTRHAAEVHRHREERTRTRDVARKRAPPRRNIRKKD